MNNHSKSAKPLNNIWPANVIYVSYTATIGRTLSYSQSLTIGADLLRARFTKDQIIISMLRREHHTQLVYKGLL